MVLGISAMLIALHLIQVQRCFVSIMRMKMIGLELMVGFGLDILTCYHMEMGQVPWNTAGSQDALLPTSIGGEVNQAISVTMKIMQ